MRQPQFRNDQSEVKVSVLIIITVVFFLGLITYAVIK